jgi:hypothetical protein
MSAIHTAKDIILITHPAKLGKGVIYLLVKKVALLANEIASLE